jgi:hypothetical protein
MSTTQTIAQLPYDIEDTATKRFLRELVDNLDGVLGYKGDNKYVKSSDFNEQGTTVAELSNQSKTATERITGVAKTVAEHSDDLMDIQKDIEELQAVLTTVSVDTVYRDFNDTAWNVLKGRAEFTALGSELVNPPPITIAPGDSYTVYIDSVKTNASVWQQVVINHGSLDVFVRIGVNSSWVKLN